MTARTDNQVESLEALLTRLGDLAQALPENDREMFQELIPELVSPEKEDRVEAIKTMLEILESAPGRLTEIDFHAFKPGERLQKWIDYISAKIREERKAAGMTQVELSDASGIPQSHISRLENGEHSPSFMTLEKIANALGIPVSKLDPSA